MDEEQVSQEDHETPEEEVAADEEEAAEELSAEEIADLKKKADVSSQNFERAKKAEKELKEAKEKGERVPEGDDLTTQDILYLAKAEIHEDDMDEVRDWAKFKGVNIQEAHKQLKTTLDVKAEERRTAEATNTKKGARGTTKNTGDDLLKTAEDKGEVPDTDEGMRRLAEARLARRKAAQK